MRPQPSRTVDIRPAPPISTTPVAPPQPQHIRWAADSSRGRDMGSSSSFKENVRPSDLVAPEITYHVPQSNQQPSRRTSLVRPHGPTAPPPRLSSNKPPPVVTPVLPPKPPTLERPPPRADRNIDKVVLGNLCFRTWYPSYYGKEVLGDTSGNAKGGSKEGSAADKAAHSKSHKDQQPMLERLYVCPSCFKYSKELVAWRGHVSVCERKAFVPGNKVYTHPRGRRKVMVPHDANKGPGPKKRKGENGVRYVEEMVQDEGEWSIWEVDGETDVVSTLRHLRSFPCAYG